MPCLTSYTPAGSSKFSHSQILSALSWFPSSLQLAMVPALSVSHCSLPPHPGLSLDLFRWQLITSAISYLTFLPWPPGTFHPSAAFPVSWRLQGISGGKLLGLKSSGKLPTLGLRVTLQEPIQSLLSMLPHMLEVTSLPASCKIRRSSKEKRQKVSSFHLVSESSLCLHSWASSVNHSLS